MKKPNQLKKKTILSCENSELIKTVGSLITMVDDLEQVAEDSELENDYDEELSHIYMVLEHYYKKLKSNIELSMNDRFNIKGIAKSILNFCYVLDFDYSNY